MFDNHQRNAGLVHLQQSRSQRRAFLAGKPRVLDNPFLLLFLGVAVPTVFYILWGIMEIVQIPIAE